MATLVLSEGAAALGSAVFGPAGAVAGRALGALAGSAIDRALFAPSEREAEPPALSDLHFQTSQEGAPVPRLFGNVRLAGQIIWAARFQHSTSSSGGGKGGSPAGGEVVYRLSLAIGLGEGPVSSIGRVWADGQLLDLSAIAMRLHKGGESQMPDSLIEAVEGQNNAPAYRGLAYVVFEDLDLSPFGNRIPQFSFEISRPLASGAERVRAATIIPGATEFGYSPTPHWRYASAGRTAPENVHNAQGLSDWNVSLDQLRETCPNCRSAALVVSWFGTDLRCGVCELHPGVESRDKITAPTQWSAAGRNRRNAHLVSRALGRPAYGGTPSDASVVEAIRDLKQRGMKVLFYPFILMDVPAGNNLPNIWNGIGQPPYPWRGRITCTPAPGQAGSPDKTPQAAGQVERFFGRAAPADFRIEGGAVRYAGREEWSLRRMILHYAYLCRLAGGVEAFLIGSELRDLTRVRSGSNSYPAVEQLRSLVRDVRAVLPSAKLSYAADWSEYAGHAPGDGSGDLYFHLDPFWSDPAVDFVGIDYYMALADWRDGRDHLDARRANSIYDHAYLASNINGGENYDWYYGSQADRESQTRRPIHDGARGKHWVFRAKDIANWWRSEHYDRPGGGEAQDPTAWRPGMKPVWLTEMGCPAVDKGANQPNVFLDAKSFESALPHFSDGSPDDLMQSRYIEAVLASFDENDPAHLAAANPLSPQNGQRMISPENIYVWTWDARPWPHFPQLEAVWGDGPNWRRGHWITGRLGAASLAAVVEDIARAAGLEDADASQLNGIVKGFVIDRVSPAREALDALMRFFFFDSAESEGRLRFFHRAQNPAARLRPAHLALERPEDAAYRLAHRPEGQLPVSVKLLFVDHEAEYRQSVAEARRLIADSRYTALARLPIAADHAQARAAAQRWLQETWIARETAAFSLPPSLLALEPGDVVRLDLPGRSLDLRLTLLQEAGARRAEAVACAPQIYGGNLPRLERAYLPGQTEAYGPPGVHLLDLPLLRGDEDPLAPHAAAAAEPWPGAVSFWRSDSPDRGFLHALTLPAPATLGQTETPLPPGPEGRWDEINQLRVRLFQGQLSSRPEADVLNGANAAALRNEEGGWEVIQFRRAELIAPDVWQLSGLLRGQAGTEDAMRDPLPSGAPFVLLGPEVRQPRFAPNLRGHKLFWRAGPTHAGPHGRAATQFSAAVQGLGLRPFSPVHPHAAPRPGGGFDISWTRRTRIGGDDWTLPDAPLGEEEEAYEVDVLKQGRVVRTLRSRAPSAFYAAEDAEADFGQTPSRLHLRIHQISRLFGRGAPREVITDV